MSLCISPFLAEGMPVSTAWGIAMHDDTISHVNLNKMIIASIITAIVVVAWNNIFAAFIAVAFGVTRQILRCQVWGDGMIVRIGQFIIRYNPHHLALVMVRVNGCAST